MNVLYLHTHDSGRYIEPYGHPVPTPNLMRLAEEGTLFRNAFTTAPTCSPSRAGMLSGTAPHCCGMTGLAHRGFRMNDYRRHLAQVLGRNGYETVLCGIQHEAPDSREIGYDRILHDKGYDPSMDSVAWDTDNARRAADYLRQAGDRPFFLSYGTFNTHRVYPEPEDGINPDYVMPPWPVADTPEARRDFAAYRMSAKVMDTCFGTVLDTLRETGLDRNTLVLFTTDHGIAFPRMKCNLQDTGIAVALILRYPGNPKAGQAEDALVSQLDVFPTLCDLLEVPRPEWLQGTSLTPLLDGTAASVRDELFAEISYHAAYEPTRCVRTRRYKLIRFFDEDRVTIPNNIDPGPSKQFLAEHGGMETERDPLQLYDLYLDPVERINRADDPRFRGVLDDLSDRMDRWMEETDDPLRHGTVPMPEGARIDPRR